MEGDLRGWKMTYDPWKTTTLAWVSAFLKGCWFLIIWGKNTVIWYNFCIMALFSIHLIWKRNFIFFTYPNNLTNHLPHKSAGHHTFIGQLTQQQKKLKIFILHCCCVNCQLTLWKCSLGLMLSKKAKSVRFCRCLCQLESNLD